MFTVAQEELTYKHIQYDQSSFTSITALILTVVPTKSDSDVCFVYNC